MLVLPKSSLYVFRLVFSGSHGGDHSAQHQGVGGPQPRLHLLRLAEAGQGHGGGVGVIYDQARE